MTSSSASGSRSANIWKMGVEPLPRTNDNRAMNKKHWRDGKDFFKAGFLHVLRRGESTGVIESLKVFPMFTGSKANPDDVHAYADFLSLAVEDVLNDGPILPIQGRADFSYFASASKFPDSDLFIDPDTGIADGGQGASREHITVKELCHLLLAGSARLLVVFQDSPRRVGDEALEVGVSRKLEMLRAAGLRCFAYFNNANNMLFVARESGTARLHRLYTYLGEVVKVPMARLLWPRQLAPQNPERAGN
jgi:hypothetical protein